MLDPVDFTVAVGVLSVASVDDWQKRSVSNRFLLLPVVYGGIVAMGRILNGELPIAMLVSITVVLGLWMGGLAGGADAKMLVALFLLLPSWLVWAAALNSLLLVPLVLLHPKCRQSIPYMIPLLGGLLLAPFTGNLIQRLILSLLARLG